MPLLAFPRSPARAAAGEHAAARRARVGKPGVGAVLGRACLAGSLDVIIHSRGVWTSAFRFSGAFLGRSAGLPGWAYDRAVRPPPSDSRASVSRKTSRRDFLFGRSAARALADRLQVPFAGRAPAGTPGFQTPSYTLRISRWAMACTFEVCLNAGQYAQGTQTALRALELVESLERQMSVFLADSELAQINRMADKQPVPVELRLFKLLQMALQLNSETAGAYDITTGPLWEVWGFARRKGAVPSQEELHQALQRVGSRFVELDADAQTVRFLRPGVQLNLGSIGKGYALDRCAELLAEAGIDDFLLHAGHSSVLARGAQHQPPPGAGQGESRATRHCTVAHEPVTKAASAGWTVGLRHPLRPDRRVAALRLQDRALGTSGGAFQSFCHQGRRLSHVIDPRTGRPAEGVLSATVLAPSAALADALATAFFVMGPEAAGVYCQDHPEIAAVLICPARHSGGMQLRSFGLGDRELEVSY